MQVKIYIQQPHYITVLQQAKNHTLSESCRNDTYIFNVLRSIFSCSVYGDILILVKVDTSVSSTKQFSEIYQHNTVIHNKELLQHDSQVIGPRVSSSKQLCDNIHKG